jgi:hypothetical protein
MPHSRIIEVMGLVVLAMCVTTHADDAGYVVGWGSNRDLSGSYPGQATPPAGNDFVAIAAGGYHSLGLKADGSIVGWGDDGWDQATPPAGNDFVAIDAGRIHSLALKSDGSIVGWGHDLHGQATPPAGNDFVAIAAGYYHGLALKADGSIVGWGHDEYGQATPPAGNDFVAMAAGYYHSLALKADGSIVGWGAGGPGQSDWPHYGQAIPPPGNDFVAISAGRQYSLALKSDGSLKVWGYIHGQMLKPPTGNEFVGIDAGEYHALALKSDGSVVGWGDDQEGQATPPAGNDFVVIAAGDRHSLALAVPVPKDVGWWKLDEMSGDVAFDSSGYGNHGTVIGGPQWVDGIKGGAIKLDGIDDYINCGNDQSLDIAAQITIAAWVKTEDAGNGKHVPFVTKGDHSYGLKHYSQNSIEFFIYSGGWWQAARFPVDGSFNGLWHHVAGTYDGAYIRLFVDGTLKASTAYSGLIASSSFDVNIGRNSEANRYYNGLIDDVRIYNYALDESEIASLGSAPTCGDAEHPYPVGDFNKDCHVNFYDFAILCQHWLEYTGP